MDSRPVSIEDVGRALDEAPTVGGPVMSGAPPANGGGGRDGDRAAGEIFDNCPVKPLGVNGKYAFFLDALGQLRAIDNMNAQNIQSLFGSAIPRLCWQFPQWDTVKNKDGEVISKDRKRNRFDQTTASLTMWQAAAECGVFDPDNAVRGVGAWQDDDGGLVYHMGDRVLYGGEVQGPGRIGGHIYPAAGAIPHPEPGGPDPVAEIEQVLSTWAWSNRDLHPVAALGMIGVMMLCGALDWRPVFWMTAAAGSGKSEFQRFLAMLHGDRGLVQSTDVTKSGLTSQLKQSSLPVAVDELEPGDERSSKEKDIVTLARVAASGGQWLRGSADQTGVGGKVYSAFLFSSILIPGIMKTQDIQRLIRLDLDPLPPGQAKLGLQPRTWRARGARLKARLIARWPSWQDRLSAWRQALELQGVMGRDADNWSTVLAMADMCQSGAIASPDMMAPLCRKVAFQQAATKEDVTNDAEAMLLHLMGQDFDTFRRGEIFTVGQWVAAAACQPGAPESLTGEALDTQRERQSKHNAKLAKVGLRVSGFGDEAQLFIANKQIQGLKNLFKDSDFHSGVWSQSARRVPGAEPSPHPLTLAGIRSRGYWIPLKSIAGMSNFPMDRDGGSPEARGPALDDDLEHF
ncbi:hypothetical protein CDZ95_26175 [Mameliella alba]|nr:hypothetical protein CDZ95_26175 [Mameliella alba]